MAAPAGWQLELIRALKTPATTVPLPLVDFEGRSIGRIECMTYGHLDDDALLETFVHWRNRNRAGWLDQRAVTLESTRAWMRRALESDRCLHRLFYAGDRLIGRGGMVELTREGYMSDGIVRGGRGGGLHFMNFVNFACMAWDFEHFDLDFIDSKVLETNALALNSTNLLGYRARHRRSLFRTRTPDGDVLTETPAETTEPAGALGAGSVVSDVQLCYTRVSRNDFEAARRRAWHERSFALHDA
jgi:hypothetical protein